MDIGLSYGKKGLNIQLPENIDVEIIEPKFEKGLDDQVGELRKALREPTGTAQLSELVGPEDTVGIIFSDITRATPYDILLPAIFAELPHVRKEQYVLFNATGTHRSNTKEELESILGPGIVGFYKIVQNDCEDDASHRHIGTTTGGNEIYIHSEFLDCDVKILTGFIEPHFFAGYSGGGKAIMPGLALLKTVQHNHRAAHMDHPKARWGITEGNPLWEDVREAARFTEPTFLLNIALNRHAGHVAGTNSRSYMQACNYDGPSCQYKKSKSLRYILLMLLL